MRLTDINRKKFNKYFWIVFAVPFALLTLLILLAALGGLGYMPRIETLENPKINLASQVISEDGKVLGRYEATGIRPKFADNLEISGVSVPASLFHEGQVI